MAEHTETLSDPLPADPLVVVREWLAQAQAAHIQPNPNAMVLATSGRDGRPSARVVLCKDIVPQPGYIVFYTNYLSAKGRQLKDNPRAAAVMHWDALHRQVRIEGQVVAAPKADSDAPLSQEQWAKIAKRMAEAGTTRDLPFKIAESLGLTRGAEVLTVRRSQLTAIAGASNAASSETGFVRRAWRYTLRRGESFSGSTWPTVSSATGTAAPNGVRSSRPETASTLSRRASASSRRTA